MSLKSTGFNCVFQSLTDSVMLFANMADKRQLDLTSRIQRDAVVSAVTVLRRSVPLLSSAMQTFVKFPDNPQALVNFFSW